VSKAPVAQNRYKADLRTFRFLLFEQFQLGDILGKGAFEAWGVDEARMVLDESYKFCCEVTGPLNSVGDREGCRLENGEVKTPTGFKAAADRLKEAGWKALSVSPHFDGQGAPRTLHVLVEEMLSGSNPAFNMYSGLAFGVAEVIEHFGTPRQQELFVKRLYHGDLGGTMCLTEPHAGSDVGSSRTTARRLPDGRYAIRGTKMFISAGDSDLTDNIVHLVLARVDGAPPGTKGLSLFIVPKRRVEDDGSAGESNDVAVAAIEHKMGINGSATCVLNFGENDACYGELVGGAENVGMTQMFKLMNMARISVGIQGVGVASSAYLSALEYAKDRKQGAAIHQWKDATAPRVSIIEHADVRRMLLDMKSRVEGIRALVVKLAHHQDLVEVYRGKDDQAAGYHQGQVDLLVPLVKAYGSDQGFRVCETAIQTFGGVGYTRDYPAEQACRDAKIFSIYEGTNHIQAMDLVGRKLGQNGGANTQAFLGDIARFIGETEKNNELGPSVKRLARAHEALAGTTMRMLGWFQGGRLTLVPLVANQYLEMMSEVAVGWLLLEGARIAQVAKGKLDDTEENAAERAFYDGKVQAARYYASQVLAMVPAKAEALASEDTSPLDITNEAF
jgi:alkylation response protein AidB-like acyl-CoA dehydrogenase